MSASLSMSDLLPPALDTWETALSNGDSLAVDGSYEQAIDEYATALTLLPEAASSTASVGRKYRILSHRANAFLALGRYGDALRDTQDAAELLSSYRADNTSAACSLQLRPGETELCLKRQGTALVGLGRLDEAKTVVEEAVRLAKLNQRPAHVIESLQQVVPPEKSVEATKKAAATAGEATTTTTPAAATAATTSTAAAAAAAAAATTTTTTSGDGSSIPSGVPSVPKYQYYQDDKFLTVRILQPQVRAPDLHVDFRSTELVVQLTVRGHALTVIGGTLHGEIIPEQCKVTIKPEKVLVKLRKKEPREWYDLLTKKKKPATPSPASAKSTKPSGEETGTTAKTKAGAEIPTKEASAESGAKGDAKPADAPAVAAADDESKAAAKATSSPPPNGAPGKVPRPYASNKNWDAIEKELEREETDATPEGDDASKKLFEMIYRNADEDTRRAMVKSYQTSGGTVLSTNWNEVAKTDYEKQRTAPKGMEWKTWEGQKLPMKQDD